MTRKYQNAGLTEELYRRLVSEYNALRVKYKPTVKHYLYRAYMLGV